MSPCRPLCPVSAASPAFPASLLTLRVLWLGMLVRMGAGRFSFPFWFWQMLPWLAKPCQGRAVAQQPEPPVPPR